MLRAGARAGAFDAALDLRDVRVRDGRFCTHSHTSVADAHDLEHES